MKELLPDLERWFSAGEQVALATVVQTWGSAPQGIGAKMALTGGGKVTGSVSGGCVEGAVFEAGLKVLETGSPRLLHYAVADETAWNAGLACGGQIDVFVQPLNVRYYRALREAVLGGRPFAITTTIRGPSDLLGCAQILAERGTLYSTIPGPLGLIAAGAARRSQIERRSQLAMLHKMAREEVEGFIEVVEAQLLLVIVGAVHASVALTRLARVMGFETVVIDPMRALGNASRFPEVDQLIQKQPADAFTEFQVTPRTAVVVLTHDPRIGDPALMETLRGPAFYVGTLGSPAAQSRRKARLKAAGLDEASLNRLRGPIGLPLGARTPEEIALAVMAEIVAVQHQAIPSR